MKKSTTKFVGVCAAALLTIGAVTPATATIFGDNGVAQAATFGPNYLVPTATWQQGTFTQAELNDLNKLPGTFNVSALACNDATHPILAKLFPGADTLTVLEALALDPANYPGYKVFMSSSLPAGTDILTLNERTAPITVTFSLANKDGKTEKTFTTTINITAVNVAAENLVKSLADKYDITEGVTIDGKKYDSTKLKTAIDDVTNVGDWFVEQISGDFDPDTALVGTAPDEFFNKLLDNATQRLRVSWVNEEGNLIQRLVDRTVTVSATEQTTPILWLSSNPLPDPGVKPTQGGAIYYTSGSTVDSVYGYTTYALNEAPLNGAAEWIKSTILDPADAKVSINSTQNPTATITLDGLGGSINSTETGIDTEYFNQAIANTPDTVEVDATGVDLTTPGNYTYTLTLTNNQGVKGTFTLPLIVKQSDNAPVYKYELGQSQNMTIKVGESFNPYEGISFWQNEKGMQGAKPADQIPTSEVKIDGAVNTNKAGVYTLTYTATNKIGKTVTVTRTITVTGQDIEAQPIAVYRAYNPNNGDHLYTTDAAEFRNVVAAGWNDEGVAWEALATQSTGAYPVYRVYNPNSGEHFYTAEKTEYDKLEKAGWKKEGTAFYSAAKDGGMSVYRAFNPNAKGPGSHIFTTDKAEYQKVIKAGWNEEGTAFYGFQ